MRPGFAPASTAAYLAVQKVSERWARGHVGRVAYTAGHYQSRRTAWCCPPAGPCAVTGSTHYRQLSVAGPVSAAVIILHYIANYYRAMLCTSAAYAVVWCPSVRPSVTFVYSIETSKHIFIFFHNRVAIPF